MPHPEISFTDPEYDPILKDLGPFSDKLVALCDDAGQQQYGKAYVPGPTDIELTPYIAVDEPQFVIRAWKQTSGSRPGVFQPHDTVARLGIVGENMFLTTEGNAAYCLTTREALLLRDVTAMAFFKTITSQNITG